MNKRSAVSIDQDARNSVKPKDLEYFSYAVAQSQRMRLDSCARSDETAAGAWQTASA